MNRNIRFIHGANAVCALVFAAHFSASPCFASFHFMQIEKVVGGVNGDARAQAVQLRMRAAAQEQLNRAKLIAWDAAGENPVVIIDFDETVSHAAAGTRILAASAALVAYTNPPVEPDFQLATLIPESYLAGGSLTFENDEETLIVWRFSWGSDSYTGDTTGALTNDDDRNFGPPFDGALPTDGLQAIEFTGAFSDKSTSNVADYALSTGPGVLTNNSSAAFTLIVPDCANPGGAGPDADDDGVRDACDGCAGDPDKSEPGLCGCDVPETDTDADGIPDCHDPDHGGVPPDNDNGNTNSNDNVGNDNDDPDNTNDNGNGDPTDNANDNDNGSGGNGGSTRSPCSPGVGGIFLALLGWFGLRLTRCATAL